jgi:hypothetical protein
MHVLLIHGLGRTPLSLALLRGRLRRHGHSLHSFGYAAWWEPFEQITRRFVAWARRTASGQPYALVGHSLGNIIVRAAWPELASHPPQHVVMLAPPNQPPLLARRLGANPLYRRLAGTCGQRLTDRAFYEGLPHPTAPVTIIAGTAGPRGPWSPFGRRPNDGVVALEETYLSPAATVHQVPALHTFIMNSPLVAQQIAALLAE